MAREPSKRIGWRIDWHERGVHIGVLATMDVGQVTVLLKRWREGESGAFDRLVPLVYDEMRQLARGQLRRAGPRHTLDTTALVHEAYLKLAGQQDMPAADRAHFLAVSACAMRQVIVDFARARLAAKRGGDQARVTLEDDSAVILAEAERVLDVDRALGKLRAHDERLARIVECRFFAGLSEEETAEALEVSLRTAQRDWKRARAWLRDALGDGETGR